MRKFWLAVLLVCFVGCAFAKKDELWDDDEASGSDAESFFQSVASLEERDTSDSPSSAASFESMFTIQATTPGCPPTYTPFTQPAYNASAGWSSSCQGTVASDFAARSALAEWNCSSTSTWGPDTRNYDAVPTGAVPADCNGITWVQQRLLEAIRYVVAMDVNYCHHHCPSWVPAGAGPASPPSECTANTTRTKPYQGVDCSNYVSFVYNYAFGNRFTSGIDAQACSPTVAPGVALNITRDQQSQFQAGDMLYIAGSGTVNSSITHVVMWTGYTVDFVNTSSPFSVTNLLKNVESTSCMRNQLTKMRTANQTAYVISDSTYNGPSYRPFAGWYYRGYSHARRVINVPAGAPKNTANLVYDSAGNCWNTAFVPQSSSVGC